MYATPKCSCVKQIIVMNYAYPSQSLLWGTINEANRDDAGAGQKKLELSPLPRLRSERARLLLLFADVLCSLLSASAALAFALGENENMPRNAVSILLTKVSPHRNVRSVSRRADLFAIRMHRLRRLHNIVRAELLQVPRRMATY